MVKGVGVVSRARTTCIAAVAGACRACMRVRSLVNPRGKTLTPVWAGPAARAIFFARRGVYYSINGLNPRGARLRVRFYYGF